MVEYGTLVDSDILAYTKIGSLISHEFCAENIKQACYELRVGSYYYDLNDPNNARHDITTNGFVILRPHQRCVVITMEKLNLPNDILGRILTKGALFSLGISPVNTYADPGFKGHLGIVLHNTSDNYLKLNYGERIAKIEFVHLCKEVDSPYSGQHGYETKIWPIQKEDHILNSQEIQELIPNNSPIQEIEYAFGSRTAELFKRVLIYERKLIFASIIYFTITLILIGIILYDNSYGNWLSPLYSIVLGILS